LAGLALLFGGRWAHAHKLNVFARCEGKTIKGYAYFPGGGRARNLEVEVVGPGGEKLGETTTDENGDFVFEARLRCDHRIVVETRDGHRASFTVEAAELPDSLRPAASVKPLPSGQPEALGPSAVEGPTMRAKDAVASRAELEEMVERAISKQIGLLREQVERYESRRRLRDILGGIGYILGLTGLVFYFLGSARRKARQKQSDRPTPS